MKKTSLLCALGFLITTTYAGQVKPANDTEPLLRLGDGYSSYEKISVGQTALDLPLTNVSYGDMQGEINLSNTVDQSDLAQNLNVNLSASGGWGNFSGSASASYIRHIEQQSYSENFSYDERFYTNALLDLSNLPKNTSGLNQQAQNLYTQGGIQGFSNLYGDAFIQQLPEGAVLIVNFQLNFSSYLDQENFDAAASGGIGSIFNASTSIQSAVSASHAHGSLEVSAYQLGGDPTQLANIFNQQPGGGYYITSCNLNNLAACQGAINGVIAYAQNDFANQISIVNGQPQGNFAAVGAPTLAYYTNNFSMPPAPPISAPIVLAQMQLSKLYNLTEQNKAFIDHLVNVPVYNQFAEDAQNAITNTQQALAYNESLFGAFNAMSCYIPGVESNCPGILNNIQQNAQAYNQSIINHFENDGWYRPDTGDYFVPTSLEDQYAGFCNEYNVWDTGYFIFDLSSDNQTVNLQAKYSDPTSSCTWQGTLTNNNGIYSGPIIVSGSNCNASTINVRPVKSYY